MARNQTPAFFAVVALLLLAAATPLALALAPPALPVVLPYNPMVGSLLTKISVYGKVCCGPTLRCPAEGPLAGASATLGCFINGVDKTNVSQAITDAGGNFLFTVANFSIKQLGPVAAVADRRLPCSVDVQIPDGTFCPLVTGGNSFNLGVPVITSLFLGSYGLEGLATTATYFEASAPV